MTEGYIVDDCDMDTDDNVKKHKISTIFLLFSGGDAARSKLGGRLLPTSNPGMQQTPAEARPTDSSGQRAYFPLALQVQLVLASSV